MGELRSPSADRNVGAAGTEVPASTLKRAPHSHAGFHPFGWAPGAHGDRQSCLRHEFSAEANSVEKCSNSAFGLGSACGNLCDFVRTKFLHAEAEMDRLFESLGPSPRDPLPCGKGPCGVVGVSFESRSLRAEAQTCCVAPSETLAESIPLHPSGRSQGVARRTFLGAPEASTTGGPGF